MKIILKDGSFKEYENSKSVIEDVYKRQYLDIWMRFRYV